jgi:hypothetical protein
MLDPESKPNIFNKIKQHKIIFGMVFFLLLVIAIPITINFLGERQETRSRAAGGAISVMLSPLTQSFNSGLSEVEVNLNGGDNDISAVDITFSITFASAQGIVTFQPSSTFSTITNSSTSASVHYVGVNPSSNQITGSSINLGKLLINASGPGTLSIGFSDIHINGSGVEGPLPIDSENTLAGNYTITSAEITTTPGATSTPEPTASSTPVPTATSIPSSTPTNTPTSSPTLPPPTATRMPTATLFPTATIASGQTTIGVSIKVTGVGIDIAGINTAPIKPQRNAQVLVINAQNNQAASLTSVVNFDSQTGLYKGTVNLGNFPSGTYLIKVRLDNTLWKQVPGIQNITAAAHTETQTATVISGDLNADNEINLLDYNLMLTCLRSDSCKSLSMTRDEIRNLAHLWIISKR